MSTKAKLRKDKTKAQIKTYLKGKGHRAADVDREVDGQTVVVAICRLHGVQVQEYRSAGGVKP